MWLTVYEAEYFSFLRPPVVSDEFHHALDS